MECFHSAHSIGHSLLLLLLLFPSNRVQFNWIQCFNSRESYSLLPFSFPQQNRIRDGYMECQIRSPTWTTFQLNYYRMATERIPKYRYKSSHGIIKGGQGYSINDRIPMTVHKYLMRQFVGEKGIPQETPPWHERILRFSSVRVNRIFHLMIRGDSSITYPLMEDMKGCRIIFLPEWLVIIMWQWIL